MLLRRSAVILLIFSGIFTEAVAQKFKPTIVVLSPSEILYDPDLREEINHFSDDDLYSAEDDETFFAGLKGLPENTRLMLIAMRQYRMRRDFASAFTTSLTGWLSFIISRDYGNCLVVPSPDISFDTTRNLRTIATKHEVQWVVNPVKLSSYLVNGKKFSTARIVVYDNRRGKVILDKEYTGDSRNPGVVLSCRDGSLKCTTQNILNQALNDVAITIIKKY